MKKLFKPFLSVGTFISLHFIAGTAFADTLCPTGSNFSNLCNIKADNAGGAIGKIVSILLIVAIILSLLYLIYGGIRWITSGGDKGKVDAARSHITAAIVGLIIALLSFFILNVVTYVFTGQTFGNFELPTLF